MRKPDINQTVAILGNIGVIAGIVFLGFELQQNNELMEAQARYNRLSLSRDAWDKMAENGELEEIKFRSRNGESLTEVERIRVDASMTRFLVNMEWMYRELPADSSERNYVRINILSNIHNPTFHRVWGARMNMFDPEFVNWIESDVLGK